ncbi:MAG: shikimate dehydrogenase [Mycobacterium kyogaense]|uniref:shikimate dehydrogenase n=1 Tax=Mycobacterium kyogaense TaxID=2212479 RepID=UPI002FFCC48B
MGSARRAAVLGSPIAHSRSPQLHLAAYRALGLDSWTYDRIECTGEQLPAMVSAFGPEWVGVSVTMPGKFAALRFADEATERARLLGSANTLVRSPAGWHADNTDVDGVIGALADVSTVDRAVVIGSGGTAPAAVAGLAARGTRHITVVARSAEKAAGALEVARRSGVLADFCDLQSAALAGVVADAHVLVNTIPADVVAPHADVLASVPALLDAIYEPWPTPLAAAVAARGGHVISGLQMLLNQAFTQVELFTGLPAPKEVMRAALFGA